MGDACLRNERDATFLDWRFGKFQVCARAQSNGSDSIQRLFTLVVRDFEPQVIFVEAFQQVDSIVVGPTSRHIGPHIQYWITPGVEGDTPGHDFLFVRLGIVAPFWAAIGFRGHWRLRGEVFVFWR